MEDLAADEQFLIQQTFGDSAYSYTCCVALSTVNRAARQLGARLPEVEGACSLNVSQLVKIRSKLKECSWLVYDIDTKQIVRACADPTVALRMPSAPNIRFSEAERRWTCMKLCKHTSGAARFSLIGTAQLEDRARIEEVAKCSIDAFKLECDDWRKISAEACINHPTRPRIRSSEKFECNHVLQTALDRIAADLRLPINQNISALSLCCGPCPLPVAVANLMAPQLVELQLKEFYLNTAELCLIASNADALKILDLSYGSHIDDTAVLELARLLQRWQHSGLHDVQSLILDGYCDLLTARNLLVLVYGASMPAKQEWEMQDLSSQITLGCPKIYLSCTSFNAHLWNATIDQVYAIDWPMLAQKESAALCRKRPAQPRKSTQPTAAAEPGPTHSANLEQASSSKYTNATRERDRYMWEPADYKCKSCGAVWKKNSVITSYRQTAVSECLRGNRKCNTRNEYKRMLDGEEFITQKSILGNGGVDLTPPIHVVTAADTFGLLVAIDPASKKRVFFKPHPDKALPAKVQLNADEVPVVLFE